MDYEVKWDDAEEDGGMPKLGALHGGLSGSREEMNVEALAEAGTGWEEEVGEEEEREEVRKRTKKVADRFIDSNGR